LTTDSPLMSPSFRNVSIAMIILLSKVPKI
jgi:hypothetical protein